MAQSLQQVREGTVGPLLPDQLSGLLRLSEIAEFYRTDTVLLENEKPIFLKKTFQIQAAVIVT